VKFSPEELSGPGAAKIAEPLSTISMDNAVNAEMESVVPFTVAFVKATDPKSASGTAVLPFTSGLSTIHSADSCAAENVIAGDLV